uniref:Uncharacterized protein n=1 Tax=Emiliania huxleyi TaxID=2903 RepID=A0A6V2SSD8_EMIHU|mmetsp:Transcript_10127/g.30491  ORF Transcript_10127/g.30491 Transcript_10127/m.30491 type:complete len:339 (-) Transcript_10127:136-1152(-)
MQIHPSTSSLRPRSNSMEIFAEAVRLPRSGKQFASAGDVQDLLSFLVDDDAGEELLRPALMETRPSSSGSDSGVEPATKPTGKKAPSKREKKEIDSWTADEDALILRLVEQHGKRWSKIAATLPGRTDNGVRNRWNRISRAAVQRDAGGEQSGYRCRRCGQPKRGHTCSALGAKPLKAAAHAVMALERLEKGAEAIPPQPQLDRRTGISGMLGTASLSPPPMPPPPFGPAAKEVSLADAAPFPAAGSATPPPPPPVVPPAHGPGDAFLSELHFSLQPAANAAASRAAPFPAPAVDLFQQAPLGGFGGVPVGLLLSQLPPRPPASAAPLWRPATPEVLA